jgi:hypothetical protein
MTDDATRNGKKKTQTVSIGSVETKDMGKLQELKQSSTLNRNINFILAFSFAVIAVGCFHIINNTELFFKFSITADTSSLGGWALDNEFLTASKSDNIACDFPIILSKTIDNKKLKNLDGLLNQPFIIRGTSRELYAVQHSFVDVVVDRF